MLKRLLKLPLKRSFFLLGPRQTGKSTLIRSQIQPSKSWFLNLFENDTFLHYSKNPSAFRLEAEEKIATGVNIVFLDEIQRIPALLNEVQILMERHPHCQCILSGSSARKLRRGGANLLAGRAIQKFLHPFCASELGNLFRLDDALLYGTLPPIAEAPPAEKIEILKTYAQTYLREEIQAEGIVRNLGGFSRFLDLVASHCGEIVSFSAISRECHLPLSTVQSYYEILEDTLVGFRLAPWIKSIRKRLVAHPRFYLFDNGVTNALNMRLTSKPDSVLRGRLFEQWVVLETKRIISYSESEAQLFFWRTNNGAEVDLLIEKHGKITAAIEIKSSSVVSGADLSGLRSFADDFPKTPSFVVCTSKNSFKLGPTLVLPWQEYLKKLPTLI